MLENVEGLVNHDGGNTLAVIMDHLQKLGYNVNYKLIDSQYFGLPQSRKRVYIVGMLDAKINLDNFEKKTVTLGEVLEHGLPTVESNFTKKLFKIIHRKKLLENLLKIKGRRK